MKKSLAPVLASFVLLLFGSAFAQTTADHELTVTIPEIVMIRMVTSDAGAAFVTFDFNAAGRADYLAALENVLAATPLPPTGTNLSEIEVLALGTGWEVTVGTSGALANTGIALSRISVTPSIADFGLAPFALDAAGAIASGGATAWTGLGISGSGYELSVDGSEIAGSDVITVTYTITAP